MRYSLLEIQAFSSAKHVGRTLEAPIENWCTDTRNYSSVPNTCFIALQGKRDGHAYIAQAYALGMRCFIVEKIDPTWLSSYDQAAFLEVENSLKAFQQLVAEHRSNFTTPVVGITGSYGKTIVKEWLAEILAISYSCCKSPKSYNSQLGVALAVSQLSEQHQYGIFEAGISTTGEMQELEGMIKPEVGIFTNIGDMHQEGFASIEAKIKEKSVLFEKAEHVICCFEHQNVLAHLEAQQIPTFSWSRSPGNEADVHFETATIGNKTKVKLIHEDVKHTFEFPFAHPAQIENALHVCAYLLLTQPDFAHFIPSLEQLSGVALRLEQLKGKNGCVLLNDSYNLDPESLDMALSYLSSIGGDKGRILLSSAPLNGLHINWEALMVKHQLEEVHIIGDETKHAHAKIFSHTTQQAFLNANPIFKQKAILIKGHRQYHLEKLTRAFEEKSHHTQLEINLSALQHNFNYFKGLVHESTQIMVMLKAFGYGSGDVEVANRLEQLGVDYIGVAYTDEGVALRKGGIQCPIFVMNPEPAGFEDLVEYQLEPEIYSFELLQDLLHFLIQRSKSGFPIHIKLDTGMKRLGFEMQDLNRLIQTLKAQPEVRVKSTLTHLAAADDSTHDTFTRDQLRTFDELTQKISSALGYAFTKHALNSSGIQRFSQAQYDMVRLGVGLYGIGTGDKHSRNLQSVIRLKSKISQIREVQAGESVGYGRRAMLTENKRIATVPIGYADGLNRKLSSGVGSLRIQGMEAPIVGNVCMDMCMVDVTHIPCRTGDEVWILENSADIQKMASKLETIPYEILTSLSQRVKRVYVEQ